MEKGTLVLTTNGGERKMSYSLVDGVYYMATKSNSNKIAQIKADKKVAIDLDQNTYDAMLVAQDVATFDDVQATYLSTMGRIQGFMYKNIFGRKNDMFIVLSEVK